MLYFPPTCWCDWLLAYNVRCNCNCFLKGRSRCTDDFQQSETTTDRQSASQLGPEISTDDPHWRYAGRTLANQSHKHYYHQQITVYFKQVNIILFSLPMFPCRSVGCRWTEALLLVTAAEILLFIDVSNFMQMRVPRALSFWQIFEPSAYPADMDEMLFCGNRHLETLLHHYGSRQENVDGDVFDPLVDEDTCRGEFLPFKRLVFTHRGGDDEGSLHRPSQLMASIFSGSSGKANIRIFPGNLEPCLQCVNVYHQWVT